MTNKINNNDGKVVDISHHQHFLRTENNHIDQKLTNALLNIIHDEESKETKRSNLLKENVQAIEDEINFKLRFGFSLGRKGREALFDFINQYDLSDEEIKSIKAIGYVSWNGKSLKIGLDRLLVFFGFSQVVLFAILAFCVALVIVYKHELSISQLILASIIYLILVLILSWLSNLFLKPYQIIQTRYQINNKENLFIQKIRSRLICTLEFQIAY